MASPDKTHKKKLKEADKAFQKQYKLLKSGKITKEEFKKKIKPFKNELIELGYPIKSSGDDEKEETPEKAEPVETKEEEIREEEPEEERSIKVNPWRKRSQLTIDEIEGRVDELSLGGKPSDGLRRLYQEKYGEDLESPAEDPLLIPFQADEEGDQEEETINEDAEDSPEPEEENGSRKGFLKSMFGKSRKER